MHLIYNVYQLLVYLLIALSVCVQFIFLVGKWVDISQTSYYLVATSFTFYILIATLFAFLAFVRHARGYYQQKDSGNLKKMLVFLIITLMPFMISKIKTTAGQENEVVMLSETDNPTNIRMTPYGVTSDYVMSAETKAGIKWATEHPPKWASECPIKSVDFTRGCLHYYFKEVRPGDITDLKHEGVDTQICQREVNYFRDFARVTYGTNTHGFAVYTRKTWSSDMEQCENYDKQAESSFHSIAYKRLSSASEKIKNNQQITQQDKADITLDLAKVSKFHAQTLIRDHYVAEAGEFMAYLDTHPELLVATVADLPKEVPQIFSAEQQTIFAELDELQQQKIGVLLHNDRAYKSYGLLEAIASKDKLPEYYVPMDATMNLGIDESKLAAEIKAGSKSECESGSAQVCANQGSADRLTAGLDAAKATCGGVLDNRPVVGMSEARFLYCTIFARTSFVEQIVLHSKAGQKAKLYYIDELNQVYIIDQKVARVVSNFS